MINEIFPPNDHERPIVAHFGRNASYDGGMRFDVPLYLIGFSNRSGSNLLAEHLASTGKFALFEENLNFDTVIDSAKNAPFETFADYIAFQVDKMTDGGRLPGFKANWTQVVMLNRLGILNMFPAIHVINVMRSDVLGQAVSFSIAAQTGQWTSGHEATSKASYKFDDISDRLFGSVYANMAMTLVCEALGISKIDVFYEDIDTEPETTVRDLCKTLGVNLDAWSPASTNLKKQRGATNDEIRRLYLEEFRRNIS